jgi:phosphoribosylformimino-5-aminoimidazole carboxamide ribotide isomerase
VRLEQGDFSRETVFSDDPMEMARRWASGGATRLHVVDLDGARTGVSANAPIIRGIAQSAGIPVQVGGGIRDEAVATRYLAEIGVDRVVIGTAAVREPELIRRLCAAWPGRVVVAVDARDGFVAVEGWTEVSTLPASDFIAALVDLGVPRVLYTDISRDGMLTQPNFEAISLLTQRYPVGVIASGGIATIGHLQELEKLGVEAAIIGRALYTGDIRLQDAILATTNQR